MNAIVSEPPMRVLVVEDEDLSRAAIVETIGLLPWIQLVGQAENGPRALALVDTLEPDVVLMDIQLPGFSGIEVLQRARARPAVVFVTAHDQHAILAFELAAVDYLLKPYDPQRLLAALERARIHLRADAVPAQCAAPLPPAGTLERLKVALSGAPLDTIFVRDRGGIVSIAIDDIVRIEADDIYVGIFAAGRRHLIHTALGDIARVLTERGFLRVHRSHLVNLRHVIGFEPHEGGRFSVRMRDGSTVIASRTHSRTIRHLAL